MRFFDAAVFLVSLAAGAAHGALEDPWPRVTQAEPGDTVGSKQPLRFRSKSQNFVAGTPLSFSGWVPRRGPTGRRVVIDGFSVTADFADINVATTAIQGEDLWRSFKRIVVEQVGGRKRWNLFGDHSRTGAYLLQPTNTVPEFADTGTTTDQDIEVQVYIPMAKPYALEAADYSLPAELLSEVLIECGDLAEMGVSTGTVTVDSATIYIVAECHEEDSIILKAEDTVFATLAESTDVIHVRTGGRLQDLTLMARGASGGASLANLTDVRMDQIDHRAFARDPDLVEFYKRHRGAATNLGSTVGGARTSDPHCNSAACPVMFSVRSSAKDGLWTDRVTLELTNSVANLYAISRVVLPKSEDVADAVMATYGIGQGAWRMKTAKGTRRNPQHWEKDEARFMPMSAPDPRHPRRSRG